MRQFWHDFENYDYDDLCAEISKLKKNQDESLEDFITRFMHFAMDFLYMIGPLSMILLSI